MAQYLIEDTTLTAIGDAIREKEGSTEVIPVPDMAARIGAITTGGVANAYSITVSGSGTNTLTITDSNLVEFYNDGDCYMFCSAELSTMGFTKGNLVYFAYDPDRSSLKKYGLQISSASGDVSMILTSDAFALSVSESGILTLTATGYIFDSVAKYYRITLIKR